MQDKLINLCIDKICLNLKLVLKLCEYQGCIIPEIIGSRIYENCFTILKEFTENDLEFLLNNKLLKIKEINLRRNQFLKIKNFDFLNGIQLNNLILSEDTKFYISSSKCRFEVKNLTIYKNKSYFNSDFESCLDSLFKNCKITNSIKFSSTNSNFYNFNKEICFNTFLENIEIIQLQNVPIDFNNFIQLLYSLKEKKSLFELSIYLHISKGVKIDKLSIRHYFNYVPNTLKKLIFKMTNKSVNDVYFFLPLLLKRLKCLEEFTCIYMPLDELLSIEILKSLKLFNSKKLTFLNVKFERISKNVNVELNSLIQQCQLLKKIYIDFDKEILDKQIQIQFFNSISSSSFVENLHDWKIKILYNYLKKKTTHQIFLSKFKSLKIFDMNYYSAMKLDDECLLKIFECNENNLEIFKLEKNLSDFICKKLPYENFYKLTEIYLKSIDFNENSHYDFFKKFKEICGKNLRIIKLEFCSLKINMTKIIGEFLSSCNCLEKIHFTKLSLDDVNGFANLFSGLISCQETLKHLHFKSDRLSEVEGMAFINFLKRCQCIRIIKIYGYHIYPVQICPVQILESLKISRRTLETCHITYLFKTQRKKQDFDDQLKLFNNLSNLVYYTDFNDGFFST